MQADYEALVVHAGNRLGDLEAVIHGATGDAEAVAAGKARHGVQFLRLFQGNVAKVVEAAVEPGQLLFGQVLQIEQQLAFGGRLGLRGRGGRNGLKVESGGFGGGFGLQYRFGRGAVGGGRRFGNGGFGGGLAGAVEFNKGRLQARGGFCFGGGSLLLAVAHGVGVAFHQCVLIGMAELGADGIAVFLFLIGVV